MAGGLSILFAGEENQQLMPLFVFMAKLGVCGVFYINYYGTLQAFSPLFCATAIGICNFFARIVTIFSPIVVELP